MDRMEMEKVKVELSTETEEFYLAYPEGWQKGVGFKVKLNGVAFSIVPISPPHIVRVSDVESGLQVLDMDLPEHVVTYEDTMQFFGLSVVPRIYQTVEKFGFKKYDEKVKTTKKMLFDKFGPMPKTAKVDTEWLRADISDTLN